MKKSNLFLENSLFHSLVGASAGFGLTYLAIYLMEHPSVDYRNFLISLIMFFVVGYFTHIISLLRKFLSLTKSKENIINKFEEYVDDRIRMFYKDSLLSLKKYEKFTNFILEITSDRVFKNSLPTLAEIENQDYEQIIKTALKYSTTKTFNATLTGKYKPHWFFNSRDHMASGEKINYLKSINVMNFSSKRLLIFDEDELKDSFGTINQEEKEIFLNFHTNVKLFWITKDDFLKETGYNLKKNKLPDCALIDNQIGLEKDGRTLKIIMGEKLRPLIKIFTQLDNDIRENKIINRQSSFKDIDFIKNNFKAKTKNE